MKAAANINTDGRTITVEVPLTLRRRGGRKRIELPIGQIAWAAARCDAPSNTLLKALARAHRWQRMLDAGEFISLHDLAKSERASPSYLARILRLTLLSPTLTEDILYGRASADITLARLMDGLPREWLRQLNPRPGGEKTASR